MGEDAVGELKEGLNYINISKILTYIKSSICIE